MRRAADSSLPTGRRSRTSWRARGNTILVCERWSTKLCRVPPSSTSSLPPPMNRTLSRRTFLRASGIAMALPLLDAMLPRSARGAARALPPRRMVAVCSYLGFHTPFLFPEQGGTNYEAPPYLKVLDPLRGNFSVFSGVSHPGVDGGHSAEMSFLTAAPHPGAPNFKNSISLDQLM